MSKDEYLITDAPLKALTIFALPMILGSFFQQIYNMADSIIVGQFVGSSALAAIGACAALTNVFICAALGAGVGAGVLVSRYFSMPVQERLQQPEKVTIAEVQRRLSRSQPELFQAVRQNTAKRWYIPDPR